MPTRTGYGAPQLPHRPQHKPRPEQNQSLTPNRPHAAEPTRKALVTRESSFIGIANNVLQLDGTTSTNVQWLATMVRYGVATIGAAWAMTVGCPTRELSTNIADTFMAHCPTGNYVDFIEWFSGLTSEDFIISMNATPDEAQMLVPRAAALVPDGQWIAENLRNDISKYKVKILGLQYDNRMARLPAVSVGDAVKLTRDYGDPYDMNAVSVDHQAGQLGTVPRSVTRLIAPQMDAGSTFDATIENIRRGSDAIVEVAIALS